MSPLTPKQIKSMIENATPLELELIWIPKIMQNQTSDEITIEGTAHQNSIGLNAFDATCITKLYKQIKAGRHLNEWEAKKAKDKLMKYSGQYAQMTQGVSKTPSMAVA